MRYYLQVVSTDTFDSSPSVLLHFDSQRYLFNCGEGTQRFCHEHKARLAKVKNVFLTRVAWDCVGGLPGMLLTMADAGTSSLGLKGPRNLTHFMAATRHFIYRDALDLSTYEFDHDDCEYKDENITVKAVHAYPFSSAPTSHLKRKSDSMDDLEDARQHLSRMFPGVTRTKAKKDATADPNAAAPVEIGRVVGNLSRTSPSPVALSYICYGPTIPGKFDPIAAKKLGVKPGVAFGVLAKGGSVTTDAGTVVESHQCMGAARPGAIFLIVDCPSPAYIDSIASSSQIASVLAEKERVRCIVHLAGPQTIQSSAYTEWIGKFPPNTQHLFVSRDVCPMDLSFRAAGILQHKLNHLDKDIFPLPYYSSKPNIDLKDIPKMPKNICATLPMTNFFIEPSVKMETTESLKAFDPSEIELDSPVPLGSDATATNEATPVIVPDIATKEIVINTPTPAVSDVASEKPVTDQAPIAVPDITIVPLGTGAAIPGKYRNVSSTLVTTPKGNILLDAGEGTLGQLFRHFGPSELPKQIQTLKMLFVSHMHADHHLGVVKILKMWSETGATRLTVVSPIKYQVWLKEYSDCESFGFDKLVFINSETFKWSKTGDKEESETPTEDEASSITNLKTDLALTKVTTVAVHHCQWAYGLVLDFEDQSRIVFSGDCRPSQDLAEAGQGADILIHEATLEDDKMDEAIKKRHCTTVEAVIIAKRMKAKNLLLTHFSQRYPKFPVLPEDMISGDGDDSLHIGIAYDLMRIELKNFARLPRLIPGLRALFPDEEVEPESESI
ncbi:beta-lactamase-like protein [Phlyctochytrium arcticum]|nr:beta-lactamase-like protein [Phlyctochytrium arcticum]